MTALSDLNPEFYRSVDNPQKGYLTFDCPKCPASEAHRFTIPTFDGVSMQGLNGAKRWALAGRPPEWDTVSLSPSIDLQEGCRWHGFVSSGQVA